jgi:hypothetical protein
LDFLSLVNIEEIGRDYKINQGGMVRLGDSDAVAGIHPGSAKEEEVE